ncbi:hypothetical protein Nmel_013757 [Mimus melanotis]
MAPGRSCLPRLMILVLCPEPRKCSWSVMSRVRRRQRRACRTQES